MKAVANKVVQAGEEGKLSDKVVLRSMLETISRNFHVKEKGRRYKPSVQQFYENLLILGGPRLAKFVSINLDGLGLNTVYEWRRKNATSLHPDGSIITYKSSLKFIEKRLMSTRFVHQCQF